VTATIETEDLKLGDHLEELRNRLIVCLVTLVGVTVLSFCYSDYLLSFITRPIGKSLEGLYFMAPYEALMTRLKASLVSGVVLSSPLLFSQLWLFVSPGLTQRERKAVFPMTLASVLLFFAGVSFAYFLVIPFALQFLLGFEGPGLSPLISVGSYISFFLTFILVFGGTFDVPVVLVGLIWLGVVKTRDLKRLRRVMIVLAFVLAAILTPTVDIFMQCLLAFPLWGLYEISIVIGSMIERRRNKE